MTRRREVGDGSCVRNNEVVHFARGGEKKNCIFKKRIRADLGTSKQFGSE